MEEERVWGPRTAEYLEFLRSCELLRLGERLGDGGRIANHYRVDGCVFAEIQLRGYYEARNFHIRKNDVVLSSFPKAGTTWAQELVYLVHSDANFEEAKAKNLSERFPYLEYPDALGYRTMLEAPSPRLIKTHLPYSLLPPGEGDPPYKIVYIARNPKDTLVSFYHFYRLIKVHDFVGTFPQMVDMFLRDEVSYAPFAKHVLEFWERRNEDRVLFLQYEDLQKDLAKEIRRIATFLGKSLSETQIEQIADHCSFRQMSINSRVKMTSWIDPAMFNTDATPFMRRGKVGDWTSHFDDHLNARMDEWIESNFGLTDLKFRF